MLENTIMMKYTPNVQGGFNISVASSMTETNER